MNERQKLSKDPEEQRKRNALAEAFGRAAQTFKEAAQSAQEMVDSLRAEGKLLEAPKKK